MPTVAVAPTPARAQTLPPGLPIIRDAEIEQLLRDYTQPILRSAGLAQQDVHVVIINDRAFNAFVMDGRHIFINAGALLDAKTPNEVIGVLAHETGHMAGGHLSRMREQMANAQTASIIAMILGVGAAVGASRGGGDAGNPAAAILGPQETIRRSLLSYMRAQEEQADRAGVKFLAATGQSPKGMYETFKRLSDQILFAAQNADPYMQSHPMPAERVAALEILAKASPLWDKKDPPELQARHDLMRAKLAGFLDRPDTVARRYPLERQQPGGALCPRHRDLPPCRSAQRHQPDRRPDPGPAEQSLFLRVEGPGAARRRPAAEAIAPLHRAIQLAPKPALIQVLLAQALNASNGAKSADEAIGLLRTALAQEPELVDGYLQLAMAYGHKGDLAQADLASAMAAFMRGDHPTARQIAARAKTRFPIGSPGWVKADDLTGTKGVAGSNIEHDIEH